MKGKEGLKKSEAAQTPGTGWCDDHMDSIKNIEQNNSKIDAGWSFKAIARIVADECNESNARPIPVLI